MPQNDFSEKEKKADKQGRMANLELLRCVAMMMVVIMHYLGKGNLLAAGSFLYRGCKRVHVYQRVLSVHLFF